MITYYNLALDAVVPASTAVIPETRPPYSPR